MTRAEQITAAEQWYSSQNFNNVSIYQMPVEKVTTSADLATAVQNAAGTGKKIIDYTPESGQTGEDGLYFQHESGVAVRLLHKKDILDGAIGSSTGLAVTDAQVEAYVANQVTQKVQNLYKSQGEVAVDGGLPTPVPADNDKVQVWKVGQGVTVTDAIFDGGSETFEKGGYLYYYSDGAWGYEERFDDVTTDDTVTSGSSNAVKSSGIYTFVNGVVNPVISDLSNLTARVSQTETDISTLNSGKLNISAYNADVAALNAENRLQTLENAADPFTTHTTDDLAEGSSNLYFSNARAKAAVASDIATAKQEAIDAAATDATTKANAAENNAKAYADTKKQEAIDAAAADAATKKQEAIDAAATDASTKKQEAIDAAATDASTKKQEAIDAAATDASTKKQEAIDAAATDATTKANAAESAAKSYADSKLPVERTFSVTGVSNGVFTLSAATISAQLSVPFRGTAQLYNAGTGQSGRGGRWEGNDFVVRFSGTYSNPADGAFEIRMTGLPN